MSPEHRARTRDGRFCAGGRPNWWNHSRRHPIPQDLKQLKAELEDKASPAFRAYLLQEVPKGEALLRQAERDSGLWKAGLGATQWYQRHLRTMLIPPGA